MLSAVPGNDAFTALLAAQAEVYHRCRCCGNNLGHSRCAVTKASDLPCRRLLFAEQFGAAPGDVARVFQSILAPA